MLQEIDITAYPFAKVSFVLSGPFPLTGSDNRYIVSFVYWLTVRIVAFAVPDTFADNVFILLLTEVIPRQSAVLSFVTDKWW